MADVPKPSGPDITIAHRLMKTQWGLAGISFVILGLRLVAGICILRRIRLADYLMVMAYACAIIQAVILTESCYWGLGRHYYYLNAEEKIQSVKFLFYCQGWGVASTMFGRLSFCCILLTFVNMHRLRRWLLWFFIWSQIIIGPLTIILIYVQCGTRLEALWDHSVEANCWSSNIQRNFGFFQSSLNSVTDLYLTVLPSIILWNLSLHLPRKLALVATLSLSVFALVASVIKCYLIKDLAARSDFTWNIIPFQMWSTTENFVVILGASIPHLNPLLQWGRELSRSGSSDRQSLELDSSSSSGRRTNTPHGSANRSFARHTRALPSEQMWSAAGGGVAGGGGGRGMGAEASESEVASESVENLVCEEKAGVVRTVRVVWLDDVANDTEAGGKEP